MSTDRVDLRLANEAWESLMTAHARLTAIFAGEGMWSEASMREYDVLYTLAKGDGPMRLCQIQDGVLLSQPALSRMIDRLVERGLLHRESDPDDRRAVRISLTEEGSRVQRETGRAHAKSVGRELGAALTPEEMRDLRALCRKLVS
ncbi:MarR family winged helix-turn-helix transcriptional regulator [Leucobacter tenebrionis]|uniref:MarR family winged helix-turn-helix transcriptional regulator n=1 Tax=Leucobacter tenebrionis TaxID=2873270 RepID=UPI001CA77CC7|nr:MarR family transcriptional regulator [Leucobacter tenebrionis]QZY51111.1 MarR family transcriptional regulator [Leucobacter tenebrionis]